MTTPDLVVLAVLLLFATWGAIRGPLRQLLSLTALGVALVLAPALTAHAVPLVEKIGGLGPQETRALAWALCVFGVLVAAGVLVGATRARIAAVGCGGKPGRAAGALLGAAKGTLVMLVAGYALLAWPAPDPDAYVSLRRDSARAAPVASERPPWRAHARRSHAAGWLVRGGGALRGLVAVPAWVDAAMDRVDAEVRRAR